MLSSRVVAVVGVLNSYPNKQAKIQDQLSYNKLVRTSRWSNKLEMNDRWSKQVGWEQDKWIRTRWSNKLEVNDRWSKQVGRTSWKWTTELSYNNYANKCGLQLTNERRNFFSISCRASCGLGLKKKGLTSHEPWSLWTRMRWIEPRQRYNKHSYMMVGG